MKLKDLTIKQEVEINGNHYIYQGVLPRDTDGKGPRKYFVFYSDKLKAEMGMAQDAQEYQQQKDAVERDLQLLQYYTNIDQANAKEARGYQFQTQQDLS